LGEELETLDREILVVSTDVPPQDGETDEQRQERENANATRAVHRQQDLAAVVPAAGQEPGQQPVNTGQVNDNVGQQVPAPPGALNNNSKKINLVQIACAPETSWGTLSEMALKSTTLHKPT
jgi:hypothetical protein